jgi:sugar porter (SP) family MFS transporter
MSASEKADVYRNLTEGSGTQKVVKNKWTLHLVFCCITVCLASFQFGFNIGSTNLPTPLIKDFFTKKYHPVYYFDNNIIGIANDLIKKNRTNSNENITIELTEIARQIDSNSSPNNATEIIDEKEKQLKMLKEMVDKDIKFLWTITNVLFVVGGMVGALSSKYVLDFIGRKNGVLFHYLFTLAGSVLVFISPMLNMPELLMTSRFMYGIQGGMACGLVPTYLSEIAPTNLRGATGVIHQLNLTIGILVAQLLGFRQLLGVESMWHVLLALPIIPALIGGVVLALFFDESPRVLLIKNKDEDKARHALEKLRNSKNVSDEIQQICQEARDTTSNEILSLKQVIMLKELRWPLFTGILLQFAQQLCGINAVFFYSNDIFKGAKIAEDQIQYAIVLTGLINVILTIVCVPLVDRLGRKPLLVYPMILIILDFILLTVFLNLNKTSTENQIYPFLSIVCIIVFIMCFAIGLGPIPFIYVAECFRQDARSAALAICMFVNWLANTILTITFPYLIDHLAENVFIVFTVIVAITVSVIIKKVPETKERTIEEIMEEFNGNSKSFYERSDHMLMNTRS